MLKEQLGKDTCRYQTPTQLRELLRELVAIPSVTQTAGEIWIAQDILRRVSELTYFQEHPSQVTLHEVGSSGRKAVAALVKSDTPTDKTVVIIAHFDVVDIEEFGPYAPYAYDMDTWTEKVKSGEVPIPAHVKDDIAAGDWLFGRGVMDMKCGLALNFAMLEQACRGAFEGNLVFLAVPDEERHSDGMIGATSLLLQWAGDYHLRYTLCVDTEPSLVSTDAPSGSYIYSGTVGKLLIGALCVGMETHVEAPFEGLSASRMVAELTRTIEFHPSLRERIGDGFTPPVTCLWMRDLKTHYSVQTPFKAAAYYNVLFMERTPTELLATFKELCTTAMQDFRRWLGRRLVDHEEQLPNLAERVTVRTFQEVYEFAAKQAPEVLWTAAARLREVSPETDLRDATLAYVNEIVTGCRILQPTVVLFVAPPFYPSISSAGDVTVRRVIGTVSQVAEARYGVMLKEQLAFPGLCDLSYAGLGKSAEAMNELVHNMPLWQQGYELPLDILEQLNIPVVNFGPFGKDAHKWTERLEAKYSFEVLPDLLQEAITAAFWEEDI